MRTQHTFACRNKKKKKKKKNFLVELSVLSGGDDNFINNKVYKLLEHPLYTEVTFIKNSFMNSSFILCKSAGSEVLSKKHHAELRLTIRTYNYSRRGIKRK